MRAVINPKFLKALPFYMLLFIFNFLHAAEEVPLWVPLEQKALKDVHRLNSSSHLSTTSAQIKSS